ncbi:MAG: DUF819 family protein [Bacteriovoracaceae bacterium]|nr:DUF819 family protein [Bacteriovoracaceae bacterium]
MPGILIYLVDKNKYMAFFGVIAWSYLVGIIFSIGFPSLVNKTFTQSLIEISILLSIPLLLFSLDIKLWLKSAKKTMLSFLFSIISIFIMAILWTYFYSYQDIDMWKIAGMLVGVYTGGTVNLTAIGVSLEMDQGKILIINTIDLIVSTVYMGFVLFFARKVLSWFLPQHETHLNENKEKECAATKKLLKNKKEFGIDLSKSFLLSILIVGTAVYSSTLFFGKIFAPYIMLIVTTLSVICSLNKKVRGLKTSYPAGEYLLYSFCMGLGSMCDLQESMLSAPLLVKVVFGACFSAIMLHFFLCYLFKIDGDTALVTNVAAVFGPAFVGPVARTLDNKQVVVSGLTCGLLGYAVGNYLGLFTSWLMKIIL